MDLYLIILIVPSVSDKFGWRKVRGRKEKEERKNNAKFSRHYIRPRTHTQRSWHALRSHQFSQFNIHEEALVLLNIKKWGLRWAKLCLVWSFAGIPVWLEEDSSNCFNNKKPTNVGKQVLLKSCWFTTLDRIQHLQISFLTTLTV